MRSRRCVAQPDVACHRSIHHHSVVYSSLLFFIWLIFCICCTHDGHLKRATSESATITGRFIYFFGLLMGADCDFSIFIVYIFVKKSTEKNSPIMESFPIYWGKNLIHSSHTTHSSHASHSSHIRSWVRVFLRCVDDDCIRCQEHRCCWDCVF